MTKFNPAQLLEATAYDNTGDKLGSVKEVFVDDASGQPTFVEVSHGLFGLSSSLVPLKGHRFDGTDLTLAFAKDRVKDAPNVDADAVLTPEEQAEVYRHYGLEGVTETTEYDVVETGAGRHAVETTDNAAFADEPVATETAAANVAATDADEIVRHEERLNVAKERVATGTAKLRKYVVTNTETVEVPVTREEVRVVREPIAPEDAAKYAGNIEETEASVVLHEDRVVVSKESVPVEKVSLAKEEIADTHTVTEQIREERIETAGVETTAGVEAELDKK